MNTKQVMELAMKAGEIILSSGAEIYRVEETIMRIFRSYDVECECFVLLSGIFITARGKDNIEFTSVKRIKGHTFNLEKIEFINSFSRTVEKDRLDFNYAMDILKDIEKSIAFKFPTKIIFAGGTSLVYTLLFKGTLTEALIAFFVSMVMFYTKTKISNIGLFTFFEFFIAGLLAGALAQASTFIFPYVDIYKITIGSIMIVVPGLAITTGIKDALYGDVVSSLYRLTEGIFITVAVGSGVAISLSIGLGYL